MERSADGKLWSATMPRVIASLLALFVAAAVLAQTGGYATRDEALKGLGAADPLQRAEAIAWIAEHGLPADDEALRQRLTDENPFVRAYAEKALWLLWGRSGDDAIDALMARAWRRCRRSSSRSRSPRSPR